MKKKLLLTLLFFAIGITTAADSTRIYPNGLGWDGGLSYRRRLKKDFTLSAVLTGGASHEKLSSERLYERTYQLTDSLGNTYDTTIVDLRIESDSILYANIGLTLGLSKRIYKIKFISLDAFLRAGYGYYWTSEPDYTDYDKFKNYYHQFNASVGLEPAIWLF